MGALSSRVRDNPVCMTAATRNGRKTYRFSKDWRYHEAVIYLSLYSYNFCWPVRTPAIGNPEGGRQKRSPAMAAGLTDHVWSMAEWLSRPAVRRYLSYEARPLGTTLKPS